MYRTLRNGRFGLARAARVAAAFMGGGLVAGVILALAPGVAAAGANGNGGIQVHVAFVDVGRCSSSEGHPACALVRTNASLFTAYNVALIVTDVDRAAGVAAVECGIHYDAQYASGLHIFSWIMCADQESPIAGPNGPWPASGSGNRIIWNPATRCQRRVPPNSTTAVALAGYFYCAAYTPDNLEVTTSPASGLAAIADCAAVVDTVEGGFVHRNPSHLGRVRFSASGTEPGYNPCGLVTPVTATTWGTIKSQFAPTR